MAVTESERKKIPDVCSREAGDVKSSTTPKKNADLEGT